MSIHGIHGTASPQAAASTATDGTLLGNAAAGRSRTKDSVEITATASAEPSENKPAPLRFPWLSRLSEQLAAASKQPATFSAPVLGDNLDKRA